MGWITNLVNKIPFVGQSSKREKEKNNSVEKKFEKAKEFIEYGITDEAVKALNQVADIGEMDLEYQQFACESLKILGELYETGKYGEIREKIDRRLATEYYDRYVRLIEDGNAYYKLGLLMLDVQNFAKAMTYLEKAAQHNVRQAYMRLGDIFENGLTRVDANKSTVVIPADIEKAKSWYQKLADQGDDKAKAALERLEYGETHVTETTPETEFEQKDRIYSQIAERRKAKGVEFHYKPNDATKLQYEYSYVHDQVEGFIHKLPKDWVKNEDVDSDEEYYAPNHTYTDFAIYVTYTTVPKDSERTVDDYLLYQNDAYDCDVNMTSYVTEYANGISARFYHKEMEKGIVTFVFKQKNRWACLRFVCSTMEIMEQYNEIIFEVANSFAFVIPTILGNKSANRTEIQYYNEAMYYYNMENYSKAMENARIALQYGSDKASYLMIELYYDEDSPYRDVKKTLAYAKQLFDVNHDPDLAFLMGTIHDQQLKEYGPALDWYLEAYRLKHKRVPFYLGRFYYYGLVEGGKRDGNKALSYLKEALENGIYEAEPYIRDIEAIGEPEQLQKTVEGWEQAIREGNADAAFQVAMNKKEQVFYMADDEEIEQAFLKAIDLGSVQAAYEYGVYCEAREKEEGYHGPKKSLDYFFRAYEAGYKDFSKEYLYQVIENKISQGVSDDEKLRLYYDVAAMGYVPAVKKLLPMVRVLDPRLKGLYTALKEVVKTGEVQALSSMYLIEQQFPELLNPEENGDTKTIQNKFFRLQVPRGCTPVINDEGGTIRFADSVVEFAVAEMPVRVDTEEEYNRVFNLLYKEYGGEENSEILVANSRMVGSGMETHKAGSHKYSILLISSKNQYLFKLSSIDRQELMRFKAQALKIALTLVESGEIYVASGDSARKHIGLTLLMSAHNDNGGMLAISKDEEEDDGFVFM